MLDSSIVISALIFNSEHINHAIDVASQDGNRLLLSTYVIDEVCRVVALKWPDRMADLNLFLQLLDYDTVETPDDSFDAEFDIRDAKDRPVVLSAIAGKADILVTGDKDFVDVKVAGLKIMHPVAFAAEYGLPE